MTLNNEVLKITTNVTAAEVAMPAGFNRKKLSAGVREEG